MTLTPVALPRLSEQAQQALAQRLAAWQRAQGLGQSGPGTPCIAVCRMDAHSRLCLGCLRHIDEIADWGLLPEADRTPIWQRLVDRLERLHHQDRSDARGEGREPPQP